MIGMGATLARAGRARKKPRAFCPGLRRSIDTADRSEAIVHADAGEIGFEADVVRRRRAAGQAAVEPAEVDVEIFSLVTPAGPQRVFDAEARGPTDFHLGSGADERFGRLDIAPGDTGGKVRQPVVPSGIADAAARGGKPGVLGLAGVNAASGATLHRGYIEVAFG